jgi:dipeptidyl aminopeptidase/acylaminoacyl peptidase
MSTASWRGRTIAVVGIVCVTLGAAPHAGAQLSVDRWLVLGPTTAPLPFGAASSDSARLEALRIKTDRPWPAEGAMVPMPGGATLRWQAGNGAAMDGSVLYAAAYVTSDRWTRASLQVTGGDAASRRVWMDGARVSAATVDLAQGKHLLLVERVGKATEAGAPLAATVTPTLGGGVLATSLDPTHAPTFRELRDVVAFTDVALNSAGTRAAYTTRRQDAVLDRNVQAMEIREVASGRLLAQLSGDASSPAWSRDGAKLAYLAASERRDVPERDMMVWDATSGAVTRVMSSEPATRVVGWSPDGEWIYYTGTVRAVAPDVFKPGEARRLTEVWQRFGTSPDKVHLFAANVRQGTRYTVVGDSSFGVAGAALSPDGKRVAFSRSAYDNASRPWLHGEVWVVDVASRESKKLVSLDREAFGAPGAFAWSPDSKAVAFCASAKELLEGEDPVFSVYANNLYAINVDRPVLVNLSEAFVPNVGGGLGCTRVAWNATDGKIYVPVDAGARTLPARTKRAVTSAVERTTLEVMRMPGEMMTTADVAAGVLVGSVEGPTTPPALYRIDVATGASSAIAQPNAGALAAVEMPAWSSWNFRNSRGEDVEAWYWTPPGFDSTKTYPMVVHYYGGTLPMKKNFENRLLWLASNGYVVLFMNPAGTPGYGQKFANYHINDWGFPAATDIIEGTEQFTKAHRYVDAARVGNFGHSYGGFMTMHLHTRTKIFRTGIALAGISNIADYWGAGASGYSYTEGTCPGCYPWNRKDVYVDRSPLFQADKITAPMLLIHGTDDTNVVPTESEQMFTALRMLGREAELVRVKGENHGINSKPSVEQLRDAIMLDWFDKQLKGRPDAWATRWSDVKR